MQYQKINVNEPFLHYLGVKVAALYINFWFRVDITLIMNIINYLSFAGSHRHVLKVPLVYDIFSIDLLESS